MTYLPPIILDGKPVEKITAFLFDKGSNDDPAVLLTNANKSFIGCYVLGMGFTFDDSNPEATSLEEMNQLISKNPINKDKIFPYIGGDEVLTDPRQSHRRYVIDFGQITEEEARKWSDLMSIIETKVKGTRSSHSTAPWWQFERLRPEMFSAISDLESFLMHPNVSSYLAFTFLPKGTIVAAPHNVFAFSNKSAFAVLQSRNHEIWARFFGSSLEDRLRYTPSDCFETFPFPPGWETNSTLEVVGKTYYEFRADLMVHHNEGLTTTYNRFHDPDEANPDILKLRELHAECDRAVLDAYGWTDIPTDCEFLLDYDDDDDEGTSKRKKPWRYRWSEEVHDEVLARLLKLNQERAEEEKLGGKPKRRKEPAKPVTADSKLPPAQKQLNLIPPDKEQLDLF